MKAHVGIYGNEMADILAKEGTKMTPTKESLVSKAELNRQVDTLIYTVWNTQWETRKDCRQTKLLFPTIDTNKSKKIMKLSRAHLSRMVRAITGHDFRKKHEGLVTGTQDTKCRFCSEQTESSYHIIAECPRLMQKRSLHFNRPLGLSITPNWEPKQLAAFLSDPTISEMEAPVRE